MTGIETTLMVGQVPIQTRVFGTSDVGKAKSLAKGPLLAFLRQIELSTARKFRKQVALPGGQGHATFLHSYGVTRAEVFLTDPSLSREPFYGGIVAELKYYTDSTVYTPQMRAEISLPQSVPMPEMASSGEIPGILAGRPSVPGIVGDEGGTTNNVIIRIASDGVVDIYRAYNPKVGDFTETNYDENAYLLSTDSTTTTNPPKTRFAKFYLCGQEVLSIPPIPVTSADFNTDTSIARSSMRTVDLITDSFAEAGAAEGIVIVALPSALYAIDTLNRAVDGLASWILLDSGDQLSFREQNDYGADFTEFASEGQLKIVCSGSNGAGVCSGWEVTITQNGAGRPTLAGTLNRMGTGYTSGTPSTTTGLHTMTGSSVGSVEVITVEESVPAEDPPVQFVDYYLFRQSLVSDYRYESHFQPGTPPFERDRLDGHVIFTSPPASTDFVVTHTSAFESPTDFGAPVVTSTETTTYTFFRSKGLPSSNGSIVHPQGGNVGTGSIEEYEGQKDLWPETAISKGGIEPHLRNMWWRINRSQPSSFPLTFYGAITSVANYEFSGGGFTSIDIVPGLPVDRNAVGVLGAQTYSRQLVLRDGTVIYDEPNLFAIYPGTPWGAQETTQVYEKHVAPLKDGWVFQNPPAYGGPWGNLGGGAVGIGSMGGFSFNSRPGTGFTDTSAPFIAVGSAPEYVAYAATWPAYQTYNYSYNAADFSSPGVYISTPEQYAALFPGSIFAAYPTGQYPGYDLSWDGGTPGPLEYPTELRWTGSAVPTSTPYADDQSEYSQLRYSGPAMTTSRDCRTDGFIAYTFEFAAFSAPAIATTPRLRAVVSQALIGNDNGVSPLEEVVHEWVALGSNGGTPPGTPVHVVFKGLI